MKRPAKNKDRSRHPVTSRALDPSVLGRVQGGADTRRFETDFGDPIGNYNFGER